MTPRRDVRPQAVGLSLLGIVALGLAIAYWPSFAWMERLPETMPLFVSKAQRHADIQSSGLRQRFAQGVLMLHMHQYEPAMITFHHVLETAPRLPEAHVNMGFALSGLERWDEARDFFASAIELNPEQANAYYGLAVALDALADRPGAVGAMRTFLHRAKADDRFRRRAEAALWEWTGQLDPALPAMKPQTNGG